MGRAPGLQPGGIGIVAQNLHQECDSSVDLGKSSKLPQATIGRVSEWSMVRH